MSNLFNKETDTNWCYNEYSFVRMSFCIYANLHLGYTPKRFTR